MGGRAWRIYLAGGLAAVALHFLLPLEGLWSNLGYDLIGLSSVAAILVAVRHHRPARPLIWWCFAAGQLLFVVGDVLYAVIDLVLHQSPFPSVADGFYLAGYPILATGLLILIRGRISGRDRAGLIDAAIIATGLGLLSWTFLMKPIAADPSLSLSERLISLAYPLADVLLLAMAARLATSPGARTVAYRLLGVALVLLLGADIGYAVLNLVSSYEGGLIDAGWLLSYVVWGTAALHPSMRSLSEVAPDRATRFSHRRLALLATTSLMAPTVLAWQGLRHQPIDVAAIVVGSVVLFLLVVLRMAGLVAKVQDQAASWSPIKDDAGAITGVSVIARDITHRQQLEEQLVRQALHDPLTGLANRALFTDRLEHALARGPGPGVSVAILVIDLDGFKDINDSLGHDAGDDLLTIAGMRLQGHARPGDTVARLGGDEFGVLLEDVAGTEAVRSAEALLEGLATPIVLRDRDLTPTASIGIAIAAGEDAETVLRNADTAMYAAKRQGKSRYALFEPAMHATVLERLDLAADLSRAVEKGQLHLCYEPQISLASGQICCLEALVRWRHPTRGEVPPGEFIPLAEETGMILPIGHWVLREACRQVKAWQERWPTPAPLTIAVNLSARQLQHPGVVDEVHAALAAAGLDPQSLVLEITETAIMEQLDAAITILTELRRLGVRLALDDFGTGYSSLSYLQRLPVDILKIDRSFVAGVAKSTEDSALARGILTLGQTLGLETVAEGIETAEQLAALRELGCQLGQGYYFARPLGPAAVDALLKRHNPRAHAPTTPAHQPTP